MVFSFMPSSAVGISESILSFAVRLLRPNVYCTSVHVLVVIIFPSYIHLIEAGSSILFFTLISHRGTPAGTF